MLPSCAKFWWLYQQITGTLLLFGPLSTIVSCYGISCHDLTRILTLFHECLGFCGCSRGISARGVRSAATFTGDQVAMERAGIAQWQKVKPAGMPGM